MHFQTLFAVPLGTICYKCTTSSTFTHSACVCSNRAEPKKKKKVDPRREQMVRERLKKKLKKLERVPPELIPIEDFTTPAKYMDETRYGSPIFSV